MLVTVLDFETTGVDNKECGMLEVGSVVWSVKEERMITAFSNIVDPRTFPDQPNTLDDRVSEDITALTGITEEMVEYGGIDMINVRDVLFSQTRMSCNYICAHNAPYERGILERYWPEQSKELIWLDTATDLELPPHYRGGHSLGALCWETHIANPAPHSALGDAIATAMLLSKYDIAKTIDNATATKIEVIAMVSYDNRQYAKDAGFRYDGNTKKWKKTIKEKQLDEMCAIWPFAVQIVQPVTTYQVAKQEPFLEPANV